MRYISVNEKIMRPEKHPSIEWTSSSLKIAERHSVNSECGVIRRPWRHKHHRETTNGHFVWSPLNHCTKNITLNYCSISGALINPRYFIFHTHKMETFRKEGSVRRCPGASFISNIIGYEPWEPRLLDSVVRHRPGHSHILNSGKPTPDNKNKGHFQIHQIKMTTSEPPSSQRFDKIGNFA